MKEITLEERKQIQLRMLIEIDAFCRKHNIRYSLAYGTLIGAIRHKGFIPWDDDVDIMMPLPDMLRFKELFKSETMCYCDVDTDKRYKYAFSRIANTQTYNKNGLISTSYGICIDLYPVLGLPLSIEGIEQFFKKGERELNRRLRIIRLVDLVKRVLPVTYVNGFNEAMKRYRDFLFQYPYERTKYFFTNGGELEMRNVHEFDLFEECTEVLFEGHKFMSIARYDDYLRHFYGDYMQLPPEDQRVPYHGGHYYWKKEK